MDHCLCPGGRFLLVLRFICDLSHSYFLTHTHKPKDVFVLKITEHSAVLSTYHLHEGSAAAVHTLMNVTDIAEL
jgi:hypothetical protein